MRACGSSILYKASIEPAARYFLPSYFDPRLVCGLWLNLGMCVLCSVIPIFGMGFYPIFIAIIILRRRHCRRRRCRHRRCRRRCRWMDGWIVVCFTFGL